MLSNNRLCACSSDQSIKIFDIINGNNFVLKADKQLAHTDEIRCIEEIETNILVSGGKGDIKIWRITNNLIANNESINNAHGNYINKIIKLENGEFASCSDDGNIKLWTNQLIEKKSFKAHHGKKINNIYYFKDDQNNNRKTLVSVSSEDESVIFWEIDSFEKIKSFLRDKSINQNNNIVKLDNLILIGEQNQITIFQILNNKIKLYTYKDDDLGNVFALNTFYNYGNNLLLAGSDLGFVFIFEICGDGNEVSLKNINIMRNNKKALKGRTNYSITCLTTYDHYIIVSSIDKLIKMYTYKFRYISFN